MSDRSLIFFTPQAIAPPTQYDNVVRSGAQVPRHTAYKQFYPLCRVAGELPGRTFWWSKCLIDLLVSINNPNQRTTSTKTAIILIILKLSWDNLSMQSNLRITSASPLNLSFKIVAKPYVFNADST